MHPYSLYADLLLHLARVEQKAEVRRTMLWQAQPLSPYSLFRNITQNELDAPLLLDWLGDAPFQQLLFIPQIHATHTRLLAIQDLIDHYDKDKDGLWNYQDFLWATLPRQDAALRQRVVQLPVKEKQAAPPSIELLKELLQGALVDLHLARRVKQQMTIEQARQLYTQIERQAGSVSSKQLREFFMRQGKKVNSRQILCIMVMVNQGRTFQKEQFLQFLSTNDTHLPLSTDIPSTLSQVKQHFLGSKVTLPRPALPNQHHPLIEQQKIEMKQDLSILMQHLHLIIQMEQSLDQAKQVLALRNDFNLIDLFLQMDSLQKGHVTASQFQIFLNNNHVHHSPSLLSLFFSRFALHSCPATLQPILTFKCFANAFSPLNQSYLHTINQRKPQLKTSTTLTKVFHQETVLLIKGIIETHLQNEYDIANIKEDIHRQSIDIVALFSEVSLALNRLPPEHLLFLNNRMASSLDSPLSCLDLLKALGQA